MSKAGAMTLRRRLVRWLLYAVVIGASVLATIVLVFAVQARLRLPELRAWHTVSLERVSLGIDDLGRMLSGGPYRGSTILVSVDATPH